MEDNKKAKSSPNCSSKNSLESDLQKSPKLFSKIKKLKWINNSIRYNKPLRLREIIQDTWEIVYE